MTVLVVGSVGYDTVITPVSRGEDLLGGSATYFSIAASYYGPVALIAVVGHDFTDQDFKLLNEHHIETSGLKQSVGSTFRWKGRYDNTDMNRRDTLDLQLNVFRDFDPILTIEQKTHDYLFLANIDPDLQLSVLSQMDSRPRLVAADTIKVWIEEKRDSLVRVVESADVIFMDEEEIHCFTQETSLVAAARSIINMGPKVVVAKRGEHGALMLYEDRFFAAPAFPLEKVIDPTGAGDSFAGGVIGYLACSNDLSEMNFRRAVVMGSVMGSLTVEALGVNKIAYLSKCNLAERFKSYSDLIRYEFPAATSEFPWMA